MNPIIVVWQVIMTSNRSPSVFRRTYLLSIRYILAEAQYFNVSRVVGQLTSCSGRLDAPRKVPTYIFTPAAKFVLLELKWGMRTDLKFCFEIRDVSTNYLTLG